MEVLWYRVKAQINWSWLLPLLGLLLAVFLLLYGNGARTVQALYPIFEYYLPLTAAFYAAGIPVFDWEQGTTDTHLTYPSSPVAQLLTLGTARAATWCVALTIATAFIHLGFVTVSVKWLSQVTAVPALALSAAAAAGATLARHQVGGWLAAGLWWVMDALAPGMFNRALYLFRISHPLPHIAPEVQTRNLLICGGLLWLVTLYLAHRRERWLK